jgi:hypothetical protein
VILCLHTLATPQSAPFLIHTIDSQHALASFTPHRQSPEPRMLSCFSSLFVLRSHCRNPWVTPGWQLSPDPELSVTCQMRICEASKLGSDKESCTPSAAACCPAVRDRLQCTWPSKPLPSPANCPLHRPIDPVVRHVAALPSAHPHQASRAALLGVMCNRAGRVVAVCVRTFEPTICKPNLLFLP